MNICAIIKNEPIYYLKEWLDYHLEIADRIYIYDNGCNISNEILRTYMTRVNINPFPGDVAQIRAYEYHCSHHPSDITLFIDADEFFVPQNKIKYLEKRCTDYGALGFNWQMFGSSGLIEATEASQRIKFTKKLPLSNPVCRHIKTMVNTSNVNRWLNPHQVELKQGTYDRPVVNGQNPDYADHFGYIEHYYCRSREDFANKIERGRADTVTSYDWRMFDAINKEAI